MRPLSETREVLENPRPMKDLREALEDERAGRLWKRDRKGRWVPAGRSRRAKTQGKGLRGRPR